jgi:hypothetical protein
MAVCPTCGAPVVPCAGCGAPVSGKFCASCGKPAATEAPRLPPELAATMPAKPPDPASAAEPPTLARPSGDERLIHVHASPVAPRTVVVVDEGGTFCGISDGRVVAVHPVGRHAVMLPLTAGLFVRHGLAGVQLGGPLGAMRDGRGASATVAGFGEARFEVVDPPAFVLGLSEPFDAEAGIERLKPIALDALRQALAEALQHGDLALAGLSAIPPPVLTRATELFRTTPRPLPGVDLAFTSATARVTDLVEPPPPPMAAPPAPAQPPAPMALGPGQAVLVQWSDGNRYPGQVLQSAGDRCLVGFPNGGQDWVPNAYLTPM